MLSLLHRGCQEGDLDHVSFAFDRTHAELCAFLRNLQANTLPYICGCFAYYAENGGPALQKVAHDCKNRRIHAPLNLMARQVLVEEATFDGTYI